MTVRHVQRRHGNTHPVRPAAVQVASSPSELSATAARRIEAVLCQAIAQRGRAALAISGGSTPLECYRLLARSRRIDWAKVDVFFVDERAVPPSHARSNYRAAVQTLLQAPGLPRANVHRMPGEASNLERAAQDYEATLRAKVPTSRGGWPFFDAMVLGVGPDGHTASLFPRDEALPPTQRWVLSVKAKPEREPRLTLTRPVLQHARHAFVLAVGEDKAAAVRRALAPEGDLFDTPARVLRHSRGEVTWILDSAAAGRSRPS